MEVARSLGGEIIAEGLETKEDCARMLRLGAVLGQGWALGTPQRLRDVLAAGMVEDDGARPRARLRDRGRSTVPPALVPGPAHTPAEPSLAVRALPLDRRPVRRSRPLHRAPGPSRPVVAGTDALLAALNPAQREAVEAPDGPLLIFAGAGSGKTRVLTHRIAYVIAARGVRPSEILAVTFTNKAAREMRGRVEKLLGTDISGMWLGTFHAVGARILRRDGDAIGIPQNFVIYDEADRLAAMRRAMQSIGIDDKRLAPAKIVHAVSAAKNELLDPRRLRRPGERLPRGRGGPHLPRLRCRAPSRRRPGLRRPADAHRPAAPGHPPGAGALPAALEPPLRRRVPGHQPRPVPDGVTAGRNSSQPHGCWR